MGISIWGADQTDLLLNNIRSYDRQLRLTPIENQYKKNDSRISAFGALSSALDRFKTATEKLSKFNEISGVRIDGDYTAFGVEGKPGLASGNYSINVKQLASAHSLTYRSQASKSEALGTDGQNDRKLVIKQENGKELEVNLSDDQTSLEGMRDAINEADGDVTATIIKSSDGSYHLSLTSKETGEESNIVSVEVNDDKLQQVIGFDKDTAATATNIEKNVIGQNSLFELNGILIERSSNKIDDAVDGLSLTLKSVTKEGAEETIKVVADNSASIDAVKAWVSAYNDLQSVIKALTKYSPVEQGEAQSSDNGALLGDATLRAIQAGMKSDLSGNYGEGEFSSLVDLGIKFMPDGTLKLEDEETLKSALSKDPDAVSFLLGGKVVPGETETREGGVANQLMSRIDSYIDSKDGIIKSITDNLNDVQSRLSKQAEAIEQQIEDSISSQRKKFIQLEVLTTNLDATMRYLESQFSSNNK